MQKELEVKMRKLVTFWLLGAASNADLTTSLIEFASAVGGTTRTPKQLNEKLDAALEKAARCVKAGKMWGEPYSDSVREALMRCFG